MQKLRKAKYYNKIYITNNLKYLKWLNAYLALADAAKPYFSHSVISSQCLIA